MIRIRLDSKLYMIINAEEKQHDHKKTIFEKQTSFSSVFKAALITQAFQPLLAPSFGSGDIHCPISNLKTNFDAFLY